MFQVSEHFRVGTLSPPPMSAPHSPSTPSEVLSNNRFSFFKNIPKSQKLTRNQPKGVVDTCADWMKFNCHICPRGIASHSSKHTCFTELHFKVNTHGSFRRNKCPFGLCVVS